MAETPHPPDSTTFDKYRLIASLGHGGMADVYLAIAQGPVGFNKLQVIKRLRSNLAEEPEFLTMFLDEARLAARIDHPNVVQTNEVGEHSGHYFIAMEYLDGQPLNRIIARSNKEGLVTKPMLLTALADALAGLHYAHDLCDYDGAPLGVVHRDASPHNIFLTYAGHTKLVDFGIAKAATRSADTRAGVLKGKIAYMAPEQARCEPVDRRADVFSIGVCLWEVLAGAKMWKGLADIDIIDRLTRGDTPGIDAAAPSESADVRAIVTKALAHDPAGRYPTAAALRTDLLAYLDRSGQRVTSEATGAALSQLFADRRVQIKALLESQLATLKTGSNPSLIDLNARSTASLPRVQPGSTSGEGTPSAIQAGGAAPSLSTKASSQRGRLTLFLAGIAAAAAIVAVLSVRRGGDATPGADPTSSGAPPATQAQGAPPAVPAATLVQLQVSARPESAVIFLDDAKLPKNPFVGKFPSDGASHRLRVEADGFTTESQILVFDKDVSLDVTLKPASTAEPTADKPVAQRAWSGFKAAPTEEPAPQAQPEPPPQQPRSGGPGKPAKRKLDKNNPWDD